MKHLVTFHRQALYTPSTPGPDDDKHKNIDMLTTKPGIVEAGVTEDARLVQILCLTLLQQSPPLVLLLLPHSRIQSLAVLHLHLMALFLQLLFRLLSMAALLLISLASLLFPEEDLHVAQNPSVCCHFPPFLHVGLH